MLQQSKQQAVRPQSGNEMEVDTGRSEPVVSGEDDMVLCQLSSDNDDAILSSGRCGWRCGRACLGPLGEEGCEDEDPMLVEREAVIPVLARDSGMPSKEEREAHNVTHLPFRPWCEYCVRGRGRDRYHRRFAGDADAQDLPTMSIDYGFLTQKCGGPACEAEVEQELDLIQDRAKARPLLVMKEYLKETVWGYLCGKKGAVGEEWLGMAINDDLTTVGVNSEYLITKSDQENAIIDILAEVSHARADKTTAREHSVLGDSDDNGKVGNAVKEVMGLVRTLRAALEARLGDRVDLHSPVTDWLVRHAGVRITRHWKRLSGKSPYRLIFGRDSALPVVEFGELVMFKPLDVCASSMPGEIRRPMGACGVVRFMHQDW